MSVFIIDVFQTVHIDYGNKYGAFVFYICGKKLTAEAGKATAVVQPRQSIVLRAFFKLRDDPLHLCEGQGFINLVADGDIVLEIAHACRMFVLKAKGLIAQTEIQKMQMDKEPRLRFRTGYASRKKFLLGEELINMTDTHPIFDGNTQIHRIRVIGKFLIDIQIIAQTDGIVLKIVEIAEIVWQRIRHSFYRLFLGKSRGHKAEGVGSVALARQKFILLPAKRDQIAVVVFHTAAGFTDPQR